jgi:hypothetical protein
LVASFALWACSNQESSIAASTSAATTTSAAAETTSPDTTTPATEPEPTTTDAATTTAAETTTTAAPEPVYLRSDGIGTARFGQPYDQVLAYLTASIPGAGDPSDGSFPVDTGDGRFLSSDSESVFVRPFSRSVCFGEALCAVFGGSSPTALTFVGWGQSDVAVGGITTQAGITVDSRWSDHLSEMNVDTGGCYSNGTATTTDGVRLDLVSTGEPFLIVNESTGEITPNLPADPSVVSVIGLSAGDLIGMPAIDC